jgi:hypothetical protein
MSATIDKMRSKHLNTCDSIELIFPEVSAEQLGPIVQFVKMCCGECAVNFENIRNHLDNSFRNWGVFIDTNCTESECLRIHSRLKERKDMLGLNLQQDSANALPQEIISQDNKADA